MDLNADLIDKLVMLRIEDPEKYKKYIESFSLVVKDLINVSIEFNK